MKKEFNPLQIMSCNGWLREKPYEGDKENYRYHITILGECDYSKITAVTYEVPSHLGVCGDYGVAWLEAEYKYNLPYCWNDLVDMQQAIIKAEENLLNIGMIFVRDYKFHGGNSSNKKRRNNKLRRIYGIDGTITEDEQEEYT